VEVQILSAAP